MADKIPYAFKYVPGPIERTQQNWLDFLAEDGQPPVSVNFIPALGGCFLVVDSDEGSGATHAKAPKDLVEAFWGWLQAQHPLVPQGRSVMVIDDDQSILKLLSIVLESSGYKVSGYGDARSALTALESAGPPDVLMVDLRMPGMDGRSFLREVRAKEIDSKVIIVSAYEAEDAAIELGADAAIAKPFVPDELLDIVKSLTVAA